jgi:DNA-binding LacI/PurR family transcriptional regulator
LKNISQKDIAAALKLSRVTVTKALQGHPDVAAKTVKKVRSKARELGYIPNFIGRALSTKKTGLIGIITPRYHHPLFAAALEYMIEAAHKKKFRTIPLISFEDPVRETANIQMLLSMNVDGLIIIPSENTFHRDHFEQAMKREVPFVFFQRVPQNFKAPYVACNDKPIVYKAISYAIQNGHRRIAFFSGPNQLNIGDRRMKGYLQALNENNLVSEECLIWNTGTTPEDGYKVFKKVMAKKINPDLIFAFNDLVAQGIYKAAGEMGLKIPDDFGVIGYGDFYSSKLLNPPLSSISLPLAKMARQAIYMIMNMIDGKKERPALFEGTFKIRKSTLSI